MGALGEHLHILLVRLVNLAGLQNLQADSTILIIGQERTTTRLADILNDTTNTHRTIQFLVKVNNQVGIFQFLDVCLATAKVLLHETNYLFNLLVSIFASIQQLKILERFLLQGNQHTCYDLFPQYGVALQPIRHHVINVLHKNNVGIYLVQVLNQRTMSTWTEQQGTVSIAEWSTVRISCYSIRRRLLLRESDIVSNTIFLSIHVCFLSDLLLEELHVLMRNGEVNMRLTIGSCIERTFYQVLLHRSTRTLWIVVEQEQALGQLSVVQSLCLQHVGGYCFEITLLNQSLDTLAIVFLANSVELTIESKLFDIIKIFLLKVSCGFVVIGIHKSEHVLEHAAGCT